MCRSSAAAPIRPSSTVRVNTRIALIIFAFITNTPVRDYPALLKSDSKYP